MEGLTMQVEQKEYVIGRVLVGGRIGEDEREKGTEIVM